MSEKLYRRFIGHWELDPASCDYKQGDPPKTGTYVIREDGDDLIFPTTFFPPANCWARLTVRGIGNGDTA